MLHGGVENRRRHAFSRPPFVETTTLAKALTNMTPSTSSAFCRRGTLAVVSSTCPRQRRRSSRACFRPSENSLGVVYAYGLKGFPHFYSGAQVYTIELGVGLVRSKH